MATPQIVFTVEGQHVQRKQRNDFKVVQLSRNYLYAGFEFLTDEWEGLTCTALFRRGDRTWTMPVDTDNTCLVPWEALVQEGDMYVSLFGGSLITTDEVLVKVAHSGFTTDVIDGLEPTRSVYETLIAYMDQTLANVRTEVAKVEDFIENFDEIDGGDFNLGD